MLMPASSIKDKGGAAIVACGLSLALAGFEGKEMTNNLINWSRHCNEEMKLFQVCGRSREKLGFSCFLPKWLVNYKICKLPILPGIFGIFRNFQIPINRHHS
jgi:hypothetical protein